MSAGQDDTSPVSGVSPGRLAYERMAAVHGGPEQTQGWWDSLEPAERARWEQPLDNPDVAVPDRLPAWMTEREPTSSPSWCRGAAEPEWTSYLPATEASTRTLASPTVHIGEDVSLHLYQGEQALRGHVTRGPVTVRLWGHDGDLPIDLTAEQAQEVGLAMLEHARRLRVIEGAQR